MSAQAARAVAPEAGKPTGEKEKMSAWETYTDGEYGQAFKFPWEVEASDKTAIGHVIPIVAALAILLPARINAGLDLRPTHSNCGFTGAKSRKCTRSSPPVRDSVATRPLKRRL